MQSRHKDGNSREVETVIYISKIKLITSGSYDCTIKIWNYETGECLNTLLGHSNAIRSLTYIENTKLIVSGIKD